MLQRKNNSNSLTTYTAMNAYKRKQLSVLRRQKHRNFRYFQQDIIVSVTFRFEVN